MRIVVSGSHASGKSSLMADFVAAHRDFVVLGDPYEELETVDTGPGLFAAQWEVAVRRLLDPDLGVDVIAERGPLDFLAYLQALEDLGWVPPGSSWGDDLGLTIAAMRQVQLLVLLPLVDGIEVSDDEDPELRLAMDAALLRLSDDVELTGTAVVVEIVGTPAQRLAQLELLVER